MLDDRAFEEAQADRSAWFSRYFVRDRRVDAAEVHVRVEIALNQMLGLQPGHLAGMAVLDLLTEPEGGARRRCRGRGKDMSKITYCASAHQQVPLNRHSPDFRARARASADLVAATRCFEPDETLRATSSPAGLCRMRKRTGGSSRWPACYGYA